MGEYQKGFEVGLTAGKAATWATEWRPIETAPMDGTRVLVADEDVGWMAVARNWPCNGGAWIEDAASGMKLNPPSHWMPLPLPPPRS